MGKVQLVRLAVDAARVARPGLPGGAQQLSTSAVPSSGAGPARTGASRPQPGCGGDSNGTDRARLQPGQVHSSDIASAGSSQVQNVPPVGPGPALARLPARPAAGDSDSFWEQGVHQMTWEVQREQSWLRGQAAESAAVREGRNMWLTLRGGPHLPGFDAAAYAAVDAVARPDDCAAAWQHVQHVARQRAVFEAWHREWLAWPHPQQLAWQRAELEAVQRFEAVLQLYHWEVWQRRTWAAQHGDMWAAWLHAQVEAWRRAQPSSAVHDCRRALGLPAYGPADHHGATAAGPCAGPYASRGGTAGQANGAPGEEGPTVLQLDTSLSSFGAWYSERASRVQAAHAARVKLLARRERQLCAVRQECLATAALLDFRRVSALDAQVPHTHAPHACYIDPGLANCAGCIITVAPNCAGHGCGTALDGQSQCARGLSAPEQACMLAALSVAGRAHLACSQPRRRAGLQHRMCTLREGPRLAPPAAVMQWICSSTQ